MQVLQGPRGCWHTTGRHLPCQRHHSHLFRGRGPAAGRCDPEPRQLPGVYREFSVSSITSPHSCSRAHTAAHQAPARYMHNRSLSWGVATRGSHNISIRSTGARGVSKFKIGSVRGGGTWAPGWGRAGTSLRDHAFQDTNQGRARWGCVARPSLSFAGSLRLPPTRSCLCCRAVWSWVGVLYRSWGQRTTGTTACGHPCQTPLLGCAPFDSPCSC